MEKLTVTIPEACKIIGVSRSSLYRLFAERRLAKVKLGNRTLIKMTDLRDLVDSMQEETP